MTGTMMNYRQKQWITGTHDELPPQTMNDWHNDELPPETMDHWHANTSRSQGGGPFVFSVKLFCDDQRVQVKRAL
jgi:hypothetical protein